MVKRVKRGTAKRRGGRPKRVHPIAPETACKMIRRMPGLDFALMIFGPYRTAEEWIRRYKERCKETGQKFESKYALNEAAELFRLDENALNNWLRRPKQYRERSY